jgi:hypothetical protein
VVPEHIVTEYHTKSCIELGISLACARAAYAEQWPNYCRTCEGYGGFVSTYDPSPAGVSLSPGWMEDFDPCTCQTDGDWWEAKCPRCGVPWYLSLPDDFLTETVQSMKETWLYWRDKRIWAMANEYAMSDVINHWLYEKENPCPVCSWKEGQDGMPPPHECYCWERSDNPMHKEPRPPRADWLEFEEGTPYADALLDLYKEDDCE